MREISIDFGTIVFTLPAFLGVMWLPLAWLVTLSEAATAFFGCLKRRKSSNELHVANPSLATPAEIKIWMVLHWALTVLPFVLALTYLHLLARRAEVLLGYWPQVMFNDPKGVYPTDARFRQIFDVIDFKVLPLAGWLVIAWVALLWALWSFYSGGKRRAIIWTFLAMWTLFCFEPAQTMAWFLD